VLSLILNMAVKDGRLARNVATGANLPRLTKEEQRFLTHAQVEALAKACARPADVSEHRRLDERENQAYRLVVLFLAYTGVRFGEMAALRVSRLDLTRRRATIAESVTVVQGKGLVWGTPNLTNAGRCRSHGSSSPNCETTSRARSPTSSCSSAYGEAGHYALRSSAPVSTWRPR